MKMSRYLKKYKYHFLALFVLIIIAGISWNSIIQKTNNSYQITDNNELEPNNKLQNISYPPTGEAGATTPVKIEQTASSTKTESFVNLKVNGEEYNFKFTPSTTLYQLMQNLSASSIKPFSFTTKEYAGMGHFVEEINGLKNNPQENKYWIYYINGESAKIGISNYFINKGDLIEWKYDKTQI